MPDEAVTAQVRRLSRECGCRLSALCLLVAFVAFPLHSGLFSLWQRPLLFLGEWLLIAVTAATLGKLVGIGIARIRLRLLLRRAQGETSHA
jgi:hypothetical protein